MAPVAASPASTHPPNATTIVGTLVGGSRCHVTSSMLILLAGKRDASCSPAAVTQNPSATWHTPAWHDSGVSIAHIGGDKARVLCQRGPQRHTPLILLSSIAVFSGIRGTER